MRAQVRVWERRKSGLPKFIHRLPVPEKHLRVFTHFSTPCILYDLFQLPMLSVRDVHHSHKLILTHIKAFSPLSEHALWVRFQLWQSEVTCGRCQHSPHKFKSSLSVNLVQDFSPALIALYCTLPGSAPRRDRLTLNCCF